MSVASTRSSGPVAYPLQTRRVAFSVNRSSTDLRVLYIVGLVMTAGRTWIEAFRHDPYSRFGWDFPGFGRIRYTIREYLLGALLVVWIARKKVITSDEGKSLAVFTMPKKPTVTSRLLDIAALFINCFIQLLQPRQGVKRSHKILGHVKETVLKTIGEEKVKSMINLNLIAVTPSLRGRGHGHALLRAVTRIADEQKLGTWLLSVNIANTKLYESHGFGTVAELVVADDDKDWKEGPITLRVMVRESQSSEEKQ